MLFLVQCFSIIVPAASQTFGDVSFTAVLSASSVTTGSNVDVTISAKGLRETGTYEVKVLFDNTILEFVGAKSSFHGMMPVIKAEGNQVLVADSNGNAENGDKDFCTLTFRARKPGNAMVTLHRVKLWDKIGYVTCYTPDISAGITVKRDSEEPLEDIEETSRDDDNINNYDKNKDETNKDGVEYSYDEKDKTIKIIPAEIPLVDKNSGVARVTIDPFAIQKAIEQVKKSDTKLEIRSVSAEIPKIEGAKAYEVVFPKAMVTADAENAPQIEIKTEAATVVMLPGMLNRLAEELQPEYLSLTVAKFDITSLSSGTQSIIGEHPVVELNVKIDGKVVFWNNPQAPVKISIPYSPTEKELEDPEHIVVYCIDGSRKVIPVPNGKYDPMTGEVTFTVTHPGLYAVSYVKKSFDDISAVPWAKKEIEVLASKGIINGTSERTFNPSDNITRADFLLLLVKTLGLTANIEDNFSDVHATDYYYEAVGIAKKLGITFGKGNNLFDHESRISRQEMMTLIARAMRLVGKLNTEGNIEDLKAYSDGGLIAEYAAESVAALVKNVFFTGYKDKLNPLGNTTRTEAAVILYRIYNK